MVVPFSIATSKVNVSMMLKSIVYFVCLSPSVLRMLGSGLMTEVVDGTTTTSTITRPSMQRTEMESRESGIPSLQSLSY